MISLVNSLIDNNQVFSAGIGLFGLGSGFALARHTFVNGVGLLRHFFVASIEITSKDPSYHWVLPWITKNCSSYSSKFSLNSKLNVNEFALSPAPGSHYFYYGGRWIKVVRERQKSIVDLASGLPFESIVLQSFGKGKLQFLQSIISQAGSESTEQTRNQIQIYTPFAHEWRHFGHPKRKRPLESVVLVENLTESILKDLNEFLCSANWYHERGIPYRRGYLLHGPPGTGKSSLVHALASHLDYSIAMMNFSDAHLSDDRLVHLFNNLPQRTILLLEDVDKAFGMQSSANGKVSSSALLNALDGVAASEERIIFMTTNHLERLDEAFIRPGRVDAQFVVGLVDAKQAKQMFLRFFPAHFELAEEFGKEAAKRLLSPARIQGLLIENKELPTRIKAF